MQATKAAVGASFLVAHFLMVGCGSQAPKDAANMVLQAVGPEGIQAGKKFNVQPDGSNAIWLNAQGVPKTAIPVLAGVQLSGVNVRDNGSLVTAIVPEKLTSKPGSYPLFLLDKASGKQSNQIQFVVK